MVELITKKKQKKGRGKSRGKKSALLLAGNSVDIDHESYLEEANRRHR